MKVLIVWHAAVVAAYQSLVEHFAELCDGEVHLVVPSSWPELPGQDVQAGDFSNGRFAVHVLKSFGPKRHYAYTLVGLSDLVRRLNPDVIYAYAGPYWAVTYQVLRARSMWAPGARMLFVSDQNLFKEYPVPFRWIERETLRRADYAVGCCTEALTRLVEKGYPAGRTMHVPLGYDPRLFSAAPGDSRNSAPDVVFVGRLLAMKGIDTLVDAMSSLSCPRRLVLVGDGPDAEHFRERLERVSFPWQMLGGIEPSAVAEILKRSAVLVLPSLTKPGKWKEQFGRVLVEAMACGCVPVGSDSGAIPEVIGDAGLIFREGDSADLAAKLSELLTDPSRRLELRARAIRRAEEAYSWSAVAGRMWSAVQAAVHLPPREAAG